MPGLLVLTAGPHSPHRQLRGRRELLRPHLPLRQDGGGEERAADLRALPRALPQGYGVRKAGREPPGSVGPGQGGGRENPGIRAACAGWTSRPPGRSAEGQDQGAGGLGVLLMPVVPQPARGRVRAAGTRQWIPATSTPLSTAPRSWATSTSSSPGSTGEAHGPPPNMRLVLGWGPAKLCPTDGGGVPNHRGGLRIPRREGGAWLGAPPDLRCSWQGPLAQHLGPGPREAERLPDGAGDHW